MEEILTDLSTPKIVAAIEENLFQFFDLFKNHPQTEQHNDQSMLCCITGIPFPLFNAVLHARLSGKDVDDAIETVITRCSKKNVPLLWWTGPATQPPDLGAYLQNYGFILVNEYPGMAVDLHNLNDQLPAPTNFKVQPVVDDNLLQTWCCVGTAGFGMPEFVINNLFDFFCYEGFSPSTRIRHYLGYLQGQPVATASLFLGAGVAGIYNVATIPAARRRGVGLRLTLAALQDARKLGYQVGVLQSSAMGAGVYQRLGFQEYCTISQYLWTGEPEVSDADLVEHIDAYL